MCGYAYYNGNGGRRDSIRIPLDDRSIFFGDAVYDMMIGANGKIYQAEEHFERLLKSAGAIGLDHGFTVDKLISIAEECIKKSELQVYSVYVQLSRSSEGRVHSALGCVGANILICIEAAELPRKLCEVKLCTSEDKRYRLCNIKTVNLLPAVLYSTDAERCGYDETILHRDGYVTECAHSNVFIMHRGILYTHPLSELILPGITRRHLILSAKMLGIRVIEEPFSLPELYSADEVLITSTTKLIRVATEVDGISYKSEDREICSALFCELLRDMLP